MGEDVYIVPTILTNDPQVFAEQLQAYPQFAKRIQIDLMDGTFTADKSLLYCLVLILDKLSLISKPWTIFWFSPAL